MERVTTPVLPQNEVREDWSTQDGQYKIEIKPEAVDQIKTEIIRGLKALPKRGTEVGGILFGAVQKTGGNFTVEIDQVLAVTTEYKFGPSFRLSEADEKAFSRAVHAWPDRTPVGWYRSNTRPTREAVPEDHALSAKYFQGPSLFLFLKPQFTGEIGATAHIAGTAPHDFDFGRFSFLDQLLNNSAEDTDPDSVPAIFDNQGRMRSPAVELAGAIPPDPGAYPPPTERLSRNAILVSVAVGAAAAAALGWVALRPHSPSSISGAPTSERAETPKAQPSSARTIAETVPSGSSTKLDLRAEYHGRSLMVRWNADTPAIVTASGADFTLEQGASKRTISLDKATLESGGLLLQPTSADLTLRLAVHSLIGDTAQTLRVIGQLASADNGAPPPGTFRLDARADTKRPDAKALTPKSADTKLADTKPTDSRVAAVKLPDMKAPEPKVPEAKPVETAANRPAENKPSASIPEQPGNRDLGVAWEPLPQRMPRLMQNVPVLPAPTSAAPAPASNSSAATSPSSASIAPPSTSSSSSASADRVPIPPKVLRRVQPQPPANIDQLKYSGAEASAGQAIDVEVDIDTRGEVTAAHVVKSSGAFSRLFEKNSIAAAMAWQFQPARLGGQSVPSKVVLNFRFSPRATR